MLVIEPDALNCYRLLQQYTGLSVEGICTNTAMKTSEST